jgi:hypothetical protein
MKKLRERETVSAAKKLLQIWERGQYEFSLPSNGPVSFLSSVKSLRIDPKARACVLRTPQ